jgi:hypothetical protein
VNSLGPPKTDKEPTSGVATTSINDRPFAAAPSNSVSCESKGNRAIRYVAQLIAKKYDKPMNDAIEIAKQVLAAKARSDNRKRDARRNEARIKIQQRFEKTKKPEYPYRVHGPALQGGIPGLGKRK